MAGGTLGVVSGGWSARGGAATRRGVFRQQRGIRGWKGAAVQVFDGANNHPVRDVDRV